MSTNKPILVALDLVAEESRKVIERARELMPNHDIHLVYAVEPIVYAYGIDGALATAPSITTMQQEAVELARRDLAELGEAYSLDPAHLHVRVGRPSNVIHELGEELDVEMIVLGSHGRNGIRLLLGSTANAVLHGAKRDVVAVRVGA